MGFKPWLDEVDIPPGKEWPVEIHRAIRQSDIFIAFLSKNSVMKPGYVQRELRLALNTLAEKPAGSTYFIPLRLDECEVPDLQIPDYGINLRNIQWLDFWKPNSFDRLVETITGNIAVLTADSVLSEELGKFDLSDAALVRAGMYLGQGALMVAWKGEMSESLRSKVYSDLQKAEIESKALESIDSLMRSITIVLPKPDATLPKPDATQTIDNVFGQVRAAADRANPAFGTEAFSFGFIFGMIVMAINRLVNIPEMDPDQSKKVLDEMQKAVGPERISPVLHWKDEIPFPQRMKLALDRMFSHERATLKDWEQMASNAACFSHLLWKVAEEGRRTLDRYQLLSDEEYAPHMSIRLEDEGFFVDIPGIPSRIPPFPQGEIR